MSSLWVSSVLFSVSVLAGFPWLDSFWLALGLTSLAIFHLAIAVRRQDPSRGELFASQLLIAGSSLSAIIAYLMTATRPSKGVGVVVFDFVLASLTSLHSYRGFTFYLLVFGAVAVSLALLFRGIGVVRGWDLSSVMRYLYAASAVNIACDYAWRRPLFHVQAEPAAHDFFFTAGLFGVEYSLPIYLLLTLLMVTLAKRDSRLVP